MTPELGNGGTMRTGLVRRLRALALGAALALPAAATTPLADSPIAGSGTSSVAGNVVLALSVEFPTAVSVAHLGDFDTTKTYLGIFDPNKCYRYRYDLAAPQMRFDPVGAATNRLCPTVEWSGPVSQWANRWSGNYLNWATMQTIDPFRVALTGGYRMTDVITPDGKSLTVLEKAWASGQGGTGNFPDRAVSGAAIVGATPMMHRSLPARTRVAGLGNRLRITGSSGNFDAPTVVRTWNPELMLAACSSAAAWPGCWTDGPSTVYELYIRVKVCDADTAAAGPLEANCTLYPNGQYKPTGLMQRYSDRLRFAAFGYLNDDNRNGRDAGVLRARMKYVGPQRPGSGGALEDNPAREWNPQTGQFVRNPDSADATATQSATGVTVSDSGVINYLNKFGSMLQNGYKTYDPVSELYYAALRYLKNQGNVPAWSAMTTSDPATRTRWVDGFPVITDWGDPWGSSCQRSAILGIGDLNTHTDRNLPGATGSGEPAKPPEVAADTTVDAIVATNKVGLLHGVANYADEIGQTGNLIAGLAYDANTRDQRPDLSGRQTIQTYWMDVLEYQWFQGSTNRFYTAGKYGAFEAPEGFDTYGRSTDIPAEWWQSGETIFGVPRPLGYFTAGTADQMINAVARVLGDIVARIRRYTASLGLALPQLAATSNASFATTFDSERWSGDLLARTLDFDSAGTPTTTQAWSFAEKLGQQAAGTGWDTGRRIVTWNPSGAAGIPFRHASLPATQRTNLDTAYRTGDDSADYLNYLRGDRTHETNSTVAGSSKAYRFRTSLVADVLRGRTRLVAKPELPYSDAANPGYAAFKTAQVARTPVAYVAANGGMLHAVEARLSGTGAGQELFAYVPSPAFAGPGSTPAVDGLQALGNPAYSHRMYLDSTPVAADVDFNRTASATGSPDWRTILVGGLGKGGRAYYALDVTTPPTPTTTETNLAQRVLWEFTDPDLGFSYGEPLVFRTAKYGWVVAFASGYNNTTGRGYVFIVNARTGALLKKLDTGAGTATAQAGLAHLQSFVRDRTDGTADVLYGGDLLGNLWRVDVTDAAGNYPAPLKLAQLADGSGAALPVTTRPTVVVQPGNLRRFVTVGTGRLLHADDVTSTTIQRFYAILDGTMAKPDTAADLPSGWTYPLTNARLLQVTDPTQSTVLDPATRRGWFIELGSAADTGWRVVEEARSFNGIVAFAAQRSPASSPCSVAGYDSRVYAIEVGSAQSRLRTVGGTGSAFIAYSTAAEGAVQSLRFVSVAGRAQLLAASDSGAVVDVPGLFGGGAAPRLISWREIRQ